MDLHQVDERRSAVRHARKTFKHACIRIGDRECPAFLRDLSHHGAGLEVAQSVTIGQTIDYRWDDEAFRSGKVIWMQSNRIGLENIALENALSPRGKAYRSVRIKAEAPVSIFSNGSKFEGELQNFAQRGLCIVSSAPIMRGALATIQIGKRQFEQVTAKWCKGNKLGFALPSPLSLTEMSNLVEGR